MEAGQAVLDSVHTIWQEWSESWRPFNGESDMQNAFANALRESMPTSFTVRREFNLDLPPECRLPPHFRPWSKYDIAVLDDSEIVGLLELDYGSTNPSVDHAL